MILSEYQEVRGAVVAAGYAEEIAWSENVKAPATPADFAREAIFVICNSGMKNTVARVIFERVIAAIEGGNSARSAFGHDGKTSAIDKIWRERKTYFDLFMAADGTDEKLATLGCIPWVGNITKWHLAKNLGVDCAKPDRHLERIAAHHGTTTHDLCAKLAQETGDRIATVDLVLWRASSLGIIKTRALEPSGATPTKPETEVKG